MKTKIYRGTKLYEKKQIFDLSNLTIEYNTP